MKTCLVFAALVLAAAAHAEVVTRDIDYTDGTTTMKGLLAYDDAVTAKRPGVLVVHEWWGHNDYARDRARQLAGLGYTALAVDMYGDGKTADHPKDAGTFAGEAMANLERAEARFRAAMQALQDHPSADADQIAAIGYCFGGGVVLHMARRGVPLKGVASFHGSLGTETPAQPGAVKAAILVCNGADDSFVTAEAIEAFKKEMADAGADMKFVNYEGATHSFTNPGATAVGEKFGLPLRYDAKANQASWQDLQDFFDKIFGSNSP